MERSWISFLSLCLLTSLSNGLQCMDDNNMPVDWFVIYKIPMQMWGIREIHKGTEYVALTSLSQTTTWTLSQKDVTMQHSALGNTLTPLYNDTVAESSIWVIYNNVNVQYKTEQSGGKGVLMVDQRQGFWLIHSVPDYPALPESGDGKGVRTPGGRYGYPDTAKTLDLWDDLVGPSLNTNLWVKSSSRKVGLSPSKCNGNLTVENINKIAIREANYAVRSGLDSSKWAISSGGNWFCIGDVNRSSTKKKRAGGAVCIQARNIWTIFRRMIDEVEKCP